MPIVWRLQVRRSQKQLISVTFLLGGLVCIISAVRLAYLRTLGPEDGTYNPVHTLELSTLEVSVGTLSACLPVYRPIYNYLRHGQATARSSGRRFQRDPTPIALDDRATLACALKEAGASDDMEKLYHSIETIATAHGDELTSLEHTGAGILVTKQLNVATSEPRT
ncbi:uncharacterized protein KY384_007208 [Bacidia gigantensis]|uniref:uncharacterized protein n=1 Tax=Bacidia gigantensis TaxID=2732470 RepID=UPI001D04A407|nr:uncharacterized protein KY384_007208 [Bacidia gigantensis]KAG8528291.1 hypothetical protein KY384_007208 [Bacidia gigantensis]